jgi:hypothetical protein
MTSNLKPVRGVALAAMTVLGLQALIMLVIGCLAVMTMSAIPWVPMDPAEAAATRRAHELHGRVEDGLLLQGYAGYGAAAVALIVWLGRVRANALVMSGSPQRWGRPWVVIGWFVPIINLWMPRQIVADVWKATVPDRSAFLVNAWWVLWLLLGVVDFSLRFVAAPRTFDAMTAQMEFVVLDSLAGIAAAVLAVLVVRAVSQAQQAHISKIAQLTEAARADA